MCCSLRSALRYLAGPLNTQPIRRRHRRGPSVLLAANLLIERHTAILRFHGGCVNVTKEIGEQLDEYMCPVCEEQTKDQVLRRSGESVPLSVSRLVWRHGFVQTVYFCRLVILGRNARITLETLRLRELSLPPAQAPPVERNESASVEPGEETAQFERAGHSVTDSPPWEVAAATRNGETEVLEPSPTTSAQKVNADEPTQSECSERERLVKPIDKLCLFPGCGKPARPADNYCSDICTIADADNLLARVTARRVDAERSLEGSVKRPGGPPPLDVAELAAAAAGSEDVSPSEPASATDAGPPSEADGATSEPKLDSAEETEVKEKHLKEEVSSEVEEDTAAVSSNSLRLAVRRELRKIFETVLKVSEEKGTLRDEITGGMPIDQLSVKWAGSCERAMLKHWSERMSTASSASCKEATGERYKARFRTIRFNLRDPKNDRLRTRLVTGCILPRDLAILTADDMASDALLEEAEELRKQSIERRLIVNDATPELMSGKMVKMTHKGWVEIEREENVGSGFPPSLSPTVAESPSLSIQKPSSPFATSTPGSPLTLKRKESAAGPETSAAATSAADLASPTRKRLRVDVLPPSQTIDENSMLPTSTEGPRKQPSSTTTTPTYQKPH
ncbi:MAG: transcription factor S-II, central domain-containing protein, partial [Olpidium bornovanus]